MASNRYTHAISNIIECLSHKKKHSVEFCKNKYHIINNYCGCMIRKVLNSIQNKIAIVSNKILQNTSKKCDLLTA